MSSPSITISRGASGFRRAVFMRVSGKGDRVAGEEAIVVDALAALEEALERERVLRAWSKGSLMLELAVLAHAWTTVPVVGVVADRPALDLEDEQARVRVREHEVRLALLWSASCRDEPGDMMKRDEVVARLVAKPLEDRSSAVLSASAGDSGIIRAMEGPRTETDQKVKARNCGLS